jgi:hypothetical protein
MMSERKRQSGPDPTRARRRAPRDPESAPDSPPQPAAGADERPLDTDEAAPPREGNFQRRLAREIAHPRSLAEHPDGSAPPLDRLTQDLDPRKDL